MISRLDRLQGRDIYENTALAKLNEVIDAVNNQQIQLNNHECRLLDLNSRLTALDDPTYHEVEPEPADPYAEQRKWRGKLCKFWDDSDKPENCVYDVLYNIFDLHHEDCPFQCGNGEWYEYCEPVKPDSDIIYKGE
jgi:hypothetical protein